MAKKKAKKKVASKKPRDTQPPMIPEFQKPQDEAIKKLMGIEPLDPSCQTCQYGSHCFCTYNPPATYLDTTGAARGIIKSAYPPCPDVPCGRWSA